MLVYCCVYIHMYVFLFICARKNVHTNMNVSTCICACTSTHMCIDHQFHPGNNWRLGGFAAGSLFRRSVWSQSSQWALGTGSWFWTSWSILGSPAPHISYLGGTAIQFTLPGNQDFCSILESTPWNQPYWLFWVSISVAWTRTRIGWLCNRITTMGYSSIPHVTILLLRSTISTDIVGNHASWSIQLIRRLSQLSYLGC